MKWRVWELHLEVMFGLYTFYMAIIALSIEKKGAMGNPRPALVPNKWGRGGEFPSRAGQGRGRAAPALSQPFAISTYRNQFTVKRTDLVLWLVCQINCLYLLDRYIWLLVSRPAILLTMLLRISMVRTSLRMEHAGTSRGRKLKKILHLGMTAST